MSSSGPSPKRPRLDAASAVASAVSSNDYTLVWFRTDLRVTVCLSAMCYAMLIYMHDRTTMLSTEQSLLGNRSLGSLFSLPGSGRPTTGLQ
jgi:hypothetical protein